VSIGYGVDPEELRQAASTMRGGTGEIQALTDYCREADPDTEAWGLCGIPFGFVYFGLAEVYRGVLGQFTAAVEGLSDNIEACADDYAAADEAIVSSLNAIGADLEGAAA
jgi:uncharacterized protein YukE